MLVKLFNEIDNIKDLYKIAEYLTKIHVVLNSDESVEYDNSRILLKNFLYVLMKNQADKILKNQKKISIKNYLNKNKISGRRLWNIVKYYPSVNRDLGQVPKAFLSNVNNKKDCAKKLYELFGKYSFILNYNFLDNPEIIQFKCSTAEFEDELSKLINKTVKVSLLGNGNIGNTFKISVYDNGKASDFVYKVFFPRKEKKRTHGVIEIIYSYYANLHGRKNQFANFLMGRFPSPYCRDAFLLTEFVTPKLNRQKSPQFYIDYLFCEEKHEGNSISGKIIDFGGLSEKTKPLKDKNLRKLVRIISSHFNFYSSTKTIAYRWYMSKKSSNDLKKYIMKVDKNFYKKAVFTIKESLKVIPDSIIRDLLNIQNWDKNHTINIVKSLKTEDIITTSYNQVCEAIKSYQLNVATEYKPTELQKGHLIINLSKKIRISYIYDFNYKITRITINKIEHNDTNTILDLKGIEIVRYDTTKKLAAIIN